MMDMMDDLSGGGGGGGTTVEIPQPLIVSGGVSSYPSRKAVICELAMRLFSNTNFTSSSNVQQAAKDAIFRAETFASVAGDMIDELTP